MALNLDRVTIEDALLEVESRCGQTGRSAAELFGSPRAHADSLGTPRDPGWLLLEICGWMICVTASILICATARKAPGVGDLLLGFPQTRLLIIISVLSVLVLLFGKLFVPRLARARTWQTAVQGLELSRQVGPPGVAA